jgi:hypothetical protein
MPRLLGDLAVHVDVVVEIVGEQRSVSTFRQKSLATAPMAAEPSRRS